MVFIEWDRLLSCPSLGVIEDFLTRVFCNLSLKLIFSSVMASDLSSIWLINITTCSFMRLNWHFNRSFTWFCYSTSWDIRSSFSLIFLTLVCWISSSSKNSSSSSDYYEGSSLWITTCINHIPSLTLPLSFGVLLRFPKLQGELILWVASENQLHIIRVCGF